MRYQINSTGAVILADQAFVDEHYADDYTLIPDAPAPAPKTDMTWLMDVGSYYDGFGAAKLAVLSSTDAIVKAAIADASVRNFIDKSRPDVQAIVMYLSGATVPGIGTITTPLITPALATTILSTKPTALEQVSTKEYLQRVGLL